MSELLLTKTGLPNTCCKCGKMQKRKWYAENEDMARSGQGKCPSCAKPKPKSKPKSEPKADFALEPPKEEAPPEKETPLEEEAT